MKLRNCCAVAFLIVVILCFSACKQRVNNNHQSEEVEALLKRKKSCHLLGGASYDSTKYIGGWNAAYAYNFVLPKTFKDSTIDVLNEKGVLVSDTSYSISIDKRASIRMWIGETIPFPLGAINVKLAAKDFARADSAAADVIKRMKQGHYPYLKKAKIDYICSGYNGYSQQITLLGHNANTNFICKTDISELPVSGDLIEKHIVFNYDNRFKQYRKVGITVINNFTGMR